MKMLMKSLRKKIPRNSSGGFVLFFGGKHKIPVLVVWRLRRHSGVISLAVKGSIFFFLAKAQSRLVHMFSFPLFACDAAVINVHCLLGMLLNS
eukprot:CCRYP_019170-RA/>CCRYP_019170-RA protein AED:0.40 eAED:0.70 QI:217/0/0.5/1/0/0/2/0/92